MKNIVPLIIAVFLGLAAVFAASRMMTTLDTPEIEEIEVVSATRDLSAKEELKESFLTKRKIPKDAFSERYILWTNAKSLINQKLIRSIARNDFITVNDIVTSRSLGAIISEGEWAVPVTFADPSIVRFLNPGDEVAIWGTFTVKKQIPNLDQTQAPTQIEERATSVLFPKVRILDVGSGDGVRREESMGGGTIIVALPPQQAGTLIAAQRVAELYPALRRDNDPTALNRLDGGVIDDETFSALRKNLKSVRIPDIPTQSL